MFKSKSDIFHSKQLSKNNFFFFFRLYLYGHPQCLIFFSENMYPNDRISEIEFTGQAVIDPCKHCRSTGVTRVMHPMYPDSRYRKCSNCLKNHRSCEGAGAEFRSIDTLRARARVCSAIIAAESARLSYLIQQMAEECAGQERRAREEAQVIVALAMQDYSSSVGDQNDGDSVTSASSVPSTVPSATSSDFLASSETDSSSSVGTSTLVELDNAPASCPEGSSEHSSSAPIDEGTINDWATQINDEILGEGWSSF